MASEELARLRRIETRVTNIAMALGVGVNTQKPEYYPPVGMLEGKLVLPSQHTALSEMLAAVPDNHIGPISLVFGGKTIAKIEISSRPEVDAREPTA